MLNTNLIFVKSLIGYQRSRDVLWAERARLAWAQLSKHSLKRQAMADAIWDGWYELKREAERCAEEARKRGQLLFCWEGTTALEAAA